MCARALTNKLTIEATVNEVAETAWLKSQGKNQRVAHPILAGANIRDRGGALSVRSKERRAQVAHASWALEV
jgi:hypothetical protein